MSTVLPGLHCWDGLGLEICDEEEEEGEKSPTVVKVVQRKSVCQW